MSFLSGILGDSADKYVDQAVDTAGEGEMRERGEEMGLSEEKGVTHSWNWFV